MSDVPAKVRGFITATLESTDQLRILLLLANEPHEWEISEICGKLYLRSDVVLPAASRLEERGLLTSSREPRRFRYQPRNAQLKTMAEQIVALDRERPVTLLNIIHARPKDIQDFADAFKLRKDQDEED